MSDTVIAMVVCVVVLVLIAGYQIVQGNRLSK